MRQEEMAKLAIALYQNVDEADQFSFMIPEILQKSNKSLLKDVILSLASSVRANIELGRTDLLQNSEDELYFLLKQVENLKS